MVKPEYRYLFYTTETGAQYKWAEFVGAESDEIKVKIFECHPVKWKNHRDEVRDFTHANWARWKEEKPAWFTEGLIQSIPDEFIPVGELAALNAAANGGKRRRSSVGLVESVRESARRSSISASAGSLD